MIDILDPERALVGVVLNHPRLLPDIEVQPGDFADPRLEHLWALMQWLDNQRQPATPITVQKNLSRVTIPGVTADLVLDLLHNAPLGPGETHARQNAHHVVENATLRRLSAAGERIQQLARAGGDSQEIAELARQEVDASSRAIAEIRLIGDEIDATLSSWEDEAPSAIPTPWEQLNYYIQGWRPGGLYIIGARPSVGKSIMGLQAAIDLTSRGYVAFHSLEMPREEVHLRTVAQLADVPMVRVQNRTLDADDWRRIAGVRGRLGEMRLAIDDRSSVRPVDIRSHARTLARRGPVGGIVVDYLQLMTESRSDRRPRHEQVADWSRSLKILAKELGVPVIALSQLNRQSEARQDKRPTMADLRESGAIEQDADVILLLHVDDSDQGAETMQVLVAKNRQGSTGVAELRRNGQVARLDKHQWSPTRSVGAA